MKTRFELEDEIMKLYAFVDNIENAVEFLAESDVDPQVIDTMSNILLGTSTLMGLHAEKMLDTMSQCFKLDQYREDTAKQNTWDKEHVWRFSNPIYYGDMSYNPEIPQTEDLTSAYSGCTLKKCGGCKKKSGVNDG